MNLLPVIPQDLRTTASPTFANLYDSGLTSGRVTYAGASGLLQDSANLTFDGTNLTCVGDVYGDNINYTAWDLKADYAFGANSFTGSGDFSGGAILGTSLESEGAIEAATKFVCDGTDPETDGIYTVGIGGTTNGTITIKGGIITAVQEAVE